MLMSFRSVMFRRCCGPLAGWGGGAAGGGGGGAGFGCSGVALAVGVGVAASGVVAPLPVRPGPGRFVVLGMGFSKVRLAMTYVLQFIRILTDRNDAARHNRLDAERLRARYQLVAFGPRVQPNLGNA